MTVEDYLANEQEGGVKHEYLGGAVYAMSGASDAHNVIEVNLTGMLYNQLRGRRCRPFGSNMQVRLRLQPNGGDYFYYPDAMIVCDPTDKREQGWRERPTVLFEIFSPSTRHIDAREKRLAYLQLPSLQAYVRIEQKRPEVVLEQRGPDGWKFQKLIGLDSTVRLPSVDVSLAMSDLYEGVVFSSTKARPAELGETPEGER